MSCLSHWFIDYVWLSFCLTDFICSGPSFLVVKYKFCNISSLCMIAPSSRRQVPTSMQQLSYLSLKVHQACGECGSPCPWPSVCMSNEQGLCVCAHIQAPACECVGTARRGSLNRCFGRGGKKTGKRGWNNVWCLFSWSSHRMVEGEPWEQQRCFRTQVTK